MASYRDHLIAAIGTMAKEPRLVAIGYNTRYGAGGGLLSGIPEERRWEMPLAENLMAGAAIGASLDGHIPLLYFERADFTFCAMDAIVNHLNHMCHLSDGLHKPAAIISVTVGNKNTPLFTGRTHTQNPCLAFRNLLTFPVVELRWKTAIDGAFQSALETAKRGMSTMIFNFKDLWASD